ncbi:hypothetical protein ACSWVZ_003845 [Photobacterium damselae]
MGKIAVITFYNTSFSSINYNLKKQKNDNIEICEIRKNFLSIVQVFFHILKNYRELDFLLINYVTLYYIFGFVFKWLGVKTVFIPHEGEPLFPKKYYHSISGLRRFLIKKSYTQYCIDNAYETIFLSELQKKVFFSNNGQILHLGSNSNFFNDRILWEKRKGVFFPSRKCEEIKGYQLISSLNDLLINKDYVYAQDEMAIAYSNAKIVVIPSIIETYSFSMVEAMLSNCIIVTSRNVGLAYDLLLEYKKVDLEELGLYIVDDLNEIDTFVLSLINNSILKEPKTRQLALEIGLDSQNISHKIKHILNEI